MDIQLKRGLLDVCVLAAIKNEDSYGYKIIKDMKPYIELSESTLYTILKRLETAKMLTNYQKALLNLPFKEDFSESFTWNFPKYFSSFEKGEITTLKKEQTLCTFTSPHKALSWTEYARECVWYGRRNEGMHMRVKYDSPEQ
mgnify:CR=1 FL=1